MDLKNKFTLYEIYCSFVWRFPGAQEKSFSLSLTLISATEYDGTGVGRFSRRWDMSFQQRVHHRWGASGREHHQSMVQWWTGGVRLANPLWSLEVKSVCELRVWTERWRKEGSDGAYQIGTNVHHFSVVESNLVSRSYGDVKTVQKCKGCGGSIGNTPKRQEHCIWLRVDSFHGTFRLIIQ